MPTDDDRKSSPTVEILPTQRVYPWAIDLQDDEGGRRVPLGSQRMIVGSSRSADIVVHDQTVSARHCALSVLGGGVAIEDLGSKNGTFVGSARVREAWAAAGTTVTIGRTALTCMTMTSELEDGDELAAPLAV